jgi:hypothetical protein
MLRHLFALLLTACVWSCAPEAALAQQCMPLEMAVARWQANPNIADVYVASPSETVAAVAIFNSMPPESEEAFDVVVLVTGKDDSGAVFVGKDGEVCATMRVPAGAWRNFVKAVRGQGA